MERDAGEGAREAALAVLARVDSRSSFADILLEKALNGLDPVERPLATELVYGVLRYRIRLDHIINTFSSMRTTALEHRVVNALRIGVYQLLFLSGVPPRAAINETVNLVKPKARARGSSRGGRKTAGFVNAVLRSVERGRGSVTYPDMERDPAAHISIRFSHPPWMVERWLSRHGREETVEICRGNLSPAPRTLRVNTLLRTRERLAVELRCEQGTGFEIREGAFSPDALVVEGRGQGGRLSACDPRYYMQDEGSQLMAYLLAPAPGESVLDACAAPGGKATHMAALMHNRGRVVALDRSRARLSRVDEAARRLGIGIIDTVSADAASPLASAVAGDGFDAILIDAPCSGLGVLRRSPDIKIFRDEGDLARLSDLQSRLLENLAPRVRPGGRVVYSVCSTEPEETDAVIDAFLDTHRGFEREDAGGYVPEVCRVLVDGSGYLRTYPHRHGVDGFFAARLKKL